jgi:predicted kinase
MINYKVEILVGIPGSGKTTYSNEMEKKNFLIISQDKTGDKYQCIREYVSGLQFKRNVIIDRTNITKDQRKIWIELAKAYGYNTIECNYFKIELRKAQERAIRRIGHENMDILSTEKKKAVCEQLFSVLELPTRREGFSKIRILNQ